MNISSGRVPRPQKVVVYGPEGIGKSTFAAAFPDPVFIDTEGSTYHMNVRRMDKPTSWTMLLQQVKYVATQRPLVCHTLILDTADWAEQLCAAEVCAKNKKSGIEDFGYGKGYTYLQEAYGELLNRLEDVIDAGINVVVTAHAKMRKFEQPDEMGSYDRWEMKLTKQVAPMLKEWADMVLFANYKTYVVAADDKGKKHKAQGGKRVVYTTHHPCWDAKNRHGLPEEIPLDYSQIAPHIPGSDTVAATAMPEATGSPAPAPEPAPVSEPEPNPLYHGVPENLAVLMQLSDVSNENVRKVIAQKGYYTMDTPWSTMEKDGFIDGWVIPFWDKIVETIKNNPRIIN